MQREFAVVLTNLEELCARLEREQDQTKRLALIRRIADEGQRLPQTEPMAPLHRFSQIDVGAASFTLGAYPAKT